jgi:uncharacterized membrane protein YqgA involved in biofilm formation
MCVLTGLVVYIIVGINVTIKWIGEWQQQGHLSKLQIKESFKTLTLIFEDLCEQQSQWTIPSNEL